MWLTLSQSSYTRAIDEPGSMSWNWFVRILSVARKSSYGYGYSKLAVSPLRIPEQNSHLRLFFSVRDVRVLMEFKISSPIHVGIHPDFGFSCSQNPLQNQTAFGVPSILSRMHIKMLGDPPAITISQIIIVSVKSITKFTIWTRCFRICITVACEFSQVTVLQYRQSHHLNSRREAVCLVPSI